VSENGHSNGNGVTLSGWGATLRASGQQVVQILVLIAGFAGLAVVMSRGFDALERAQGAVLDRLAASAAEHQAVVATNRDLACTLALPQEARPGAIADPQGVCHYVMVIYLSEGRRPR
jgi:hypothetical protein